MCLRHFVLEMGSENFVESGGGAGLQLWFLQALWALQ